MAKTYSNNWDAKKLIINFNYKEWRQDFAAFIKEKKYWGITRVTRSKVISNNTFDKGIKAFEVYNQYGGNVRVSYRNNNEIIDTNATDLIQQYFEERVISE